MQLSPAILEAAYAYLAETPPFNEWNMPDAEEVIFEVSQSKRKQGHCQCAPNDGGTFKIMISDRYHEYTNSLMNTTAHEMVHVHQYRTGLHKTWHGRAFTALAKEVCDAHGFDPGQF